MTEEPATPAPPTYSLAVDAARPPFIERFQGIEVLGDAEYSLPTPAVGAWGVRVYSRLQDVDGGDNAAFPHTRNWVSAGRPAYERIRWADGHLETHGESDAGGFLFTVHHQDGPNDYPDTGEWAYALIGDSQP